MAASRAERPKLEQAEAQGAPSSRGTRWAAESRGTRACDSQAQVLGCTLLGKSETHTLRGYGRLECSRKQDQCTGELLDTFKGAAERSRLVSPSRPPVLLKGGPERFQIKHGILFPLQDARA